MKRYSNIELKEKGIEQFRAMQANTDGTIIFSYGLPVALKVNGVWISAQGYHNFSRTTGKQLYKIMGMDSAERKKEMNIVDEDVFLKLVFNYMK